MRIIVIGAGVMDGATAEGLLKSLEISVPYYGMHIRKFGTAVPYYGTHIPNNGTEIYYRDKNIFMWFNYLS